jgi:menaquinone-dependent protoporphyrinogen oxidase
VSRILIAYAPRHDQTGEIAVVIGEELSRIGHRVEVRPCARASEPHVYDAVIVGSTLSCYGWALDAMEYVRGNAGALAARPSWLFESVVSEIESYLTAESWNLARLIGAEPPVRFIDIDTRRLTQQPLVNPAARFAADWAPVRAWARGLRDDLDLDSPGMRSSESGDSAHSPIPNHTLHNSRDDNVAHRRSIKAS